MEPAAHESRAARRSPPFTWTPTLSGSLAGRVAPLDLPAARVQEERFEQRSAQEVLEASLGSQGATTASSRPGSPGGSHQRKFGEHYTTGDLVVAGLRAPVVTREQLEAEPDIEGEPAPGRRRKRRHGKKAEAVAEAPEPPPGTEVPSPQSQKARPTSPERRLLEQMGWREDEPLAPIEGPGAASTALIRARDARRAAAQANFEAWRLTNSP